MCVLIGAGNNQPMHHHRHTEAHTIHMLVVQFWMPDGVNLLLLYESVTEIELSTTEYATTVQ